MKNNRPEWEQQLSNSPKTDGGFSPKLMKKIEEKVALTTMKNRNPLRRWSSVIGVAVIVILILFTAQQQSWFQATPDIIDPSDSTPIENNLDVDPNVDSNIDPVVNPDIDPDIDQSNSNYFNPSEIKVGDQVMGWTVTKVHDNYFDVPGGSAIFTSFEGELEISGTFEFYYDDAPYNSSDVIFRLNEASTARVPVPMAYAPQRNTRVILFFDRDEDKELFGPPGTSGEATIVISGYDTLMAEAYGGVIDRTKFKSLLSIESIPYNSPEKMNLDAMKNVSDFAPLQFNPEDFETEDLTAIYDWLDEVSRTYNQGLQMDERRITLEQREEFDPWLQQVFTPSLTLSLLDSGVPQVQGGYIVAGYLGLIPPIGPHKVEHPSLILKEDNVYHYSVQLSSGSTLVTLNCELHHVDGVWKISQFTHEY